MGVFEWLFGKSASGPKYARKAQLSAEFLAAQRSRLDAIGSWTIEADADNLDIHWHAPTSLRGHWVTLDLQFHTDNASPSFDPDARMFELWDLFRTRQPLFVKQLRRITASGSAITGAVETARVVVYREGHEHEAPSYTLQVLFTFKGDVEHLYWADYDEAAGGFVSLDC